LTEVACSNLLTKLIAMVAWFKSPRPAIYPVVGTVLAELQEQTTRKLAELKAYLQKKLADHEDEIKTIRSFLDTVDSLLAEKSYRKIEIPRSIMEAATKAPTEQHGQLITTMSGVGLAEVFVEGRDLRVTPSPELKLDANAAPLKAFLVGKVLEPMRVGDEEAARKRGLSPDRVLSYKVDQEGALFKQLVISNYGDERRLNEIRNAVRWALRKMYEKTIGT
jgi:hypothetical protein